MKILPIIAAVAGLANSLTRENSLEHEAETGCYKGQCYVYCFGWSGWWCYTGGVNDSGVRKCSSDTICSALTNANCKTACFW